MKKVHKIQIVGFGDLINEGYNTDSRFTPPPSDHLRCPSAATVHRYERVMGRL